MPNKPAKRNKARRNKEKRDRMEKNELREDDPPLDALGTLALDDKPTSSGANATESQRLFEIRGIPGKGKGMIALVDIPKGTLIIEETALLSIQAQMRWEVEIMIAYAAAKLDVNQKAALKSLSKFPHEGETELSSIFNTNSLPVGRSGVAVFEIISRINHSCRPNTYCCWNENLEKETVYAVRPIRRGEEITIHYGRAEPRAERRAWLKRNFGFDCSCEACSAPPAEVRASDIRIKRIRELDEAIRAPGRAETQTASVRAECEELMSLLKAEPGSDPMLMANALHDAYHIAAAQGRATAAKEYGRLGYRICLLAQGPEHPRTLQAKSHMLGDPDTAFDIGCHQN